MAEAAEAEAQADAELVRRAQDRECDGVCRPVDGGRACIEGVVDVGEARPGVSGDADELWPGRNPEGLGSGLLGARLKPAQWSPFQAQGSDAGSS